MAVRPPVTIMESKTCSKADALKALVELRDSQGYKLVNDAAEHEAQEILEALLSPSYFTIPDASIKMVSMIGEIRGLRWPRRCIEEVITKLTREINEEKNPHEQENSQQESEV